MPHIFISYAKKDTYELALSLADALDALPGVTAWVDRSLLAGTNFEIEIQREIDRCDFVVVLYSPDINRHKHGEKASFVLTEIAYANYTANKKIIPVMAQRTAPPMSLTTLHYIDFTSNRLTVADLVNAIAEQISRHNLKSPQPDPHPSPPPSTPFEPVRSRPKDAIRTAIQKAWSFAGNLNRDWQPFTVKFPALNVPNMSFCLVPVGTLEMGSETEKPIHFQSISQPYWIAQHPVTNAQWAAAVRAGVVKEPYGDGLNWYRDSKMADVPVVGVTWFMARDYTEWLGCRLPTELEWEYAARGIESWAYPWGNKWDSSRVVMRENSGGKPALVTNKPDGRSWVEAYHMSGNVWEWMGSQYESYPYPADGSREMGADLSINVMRVLRGGSWSSSDLSSFTAYRRDWVSHFGWKENWGLRCVRSI